MKRKVSAGCGGKRGLLVHWLGAPVRALSRACDYYVRKMSSWEGAMPAQYAGMQQAAPFSSRSTRRGPGDGDEDVHELVRAMSQRQQQQRAVRAVAAQARSRSVAVGRIDEDAPCEFGADGGTVGIGIPPAALRRSRSVAVGGGADAGFPPRVVVGGGGFDASAVARKAAGGVGAGLPPRVGGGGGGFGASAVTRKAAGGVGGGLPPRPPPPSRGKLQAASRTAAS